MKWKSVGHQIYESGEWTIENQKTFLNPQAGWAVYRDREFVGRLRTLEAAKIRVEMERTGKVPKYIDEQR